MIAFNLEKYISYVKDTLDSSIDDFYIEKDYFLSLFLSTWQNLRVKGEINALDELIFKGGTLLMRNHLDYPRLSEDLDFTHKNSDEIRTMSQNKRIDKIRYLIIPILEEIKKICDICGFDFNIDRSDTTYVTAYHHKAVYSLSMYKISEITNLSVRIKMEINFVEHLQYKTILQTINPIVSHDAVLASLGYTLVPLQLPCYSLKEIVLEKYRAILTRDNPMERDMYDLYLINKKKLDVFSFGDYEICKKIQSGRLTSSRFKENLRNNCEYLLTKGFFDPQDDITSLSLKPIDKGDYEMFKKKLFKRLQDICKNY